MYVFSHLIGSSHHNAISSQRARTIITILLHEQGFDSSRRKVHFNRKDGLSTTNGDEDVIPIFLSAPSKCVDKFSIQGEFIKVKFVKIDG